MQSTRLLKFTGAAASVVYCTSNTCGTVPNAVNGALGSLAKTLVAIVFIYVIAASV